MKLEAISHCETNDNAIQRTFIWKWKEPYGFLHTLAITCRLCNWQFSQMFEKCNVGMKGTKPAYIMHMTEMWLCGFPWEKEMSCLTTMNLWCGGNPLCVSVIFRTITIWHWCNELCKSANYIILSIVESQRRQLCDACSWIIKNNTFFVLTKQRIFHYEHKITLSRWTKWMGETLIENYSRVNATMTHFGGQILIWTRHGWHLAKTFSSPTFYFFVCVCYLPHGWNHDDFLREWKGGCCCKLFKN